MNKNETIYVSDFNGSDMPEDFYDASIPRGALSPSSFSLYRTCPKSYEFRYIAELYSPGNYNMLRGTAIHAGAEFAIKAKLKEGEYPTVDSVLDRVSDVYDDKVVEVEDTEDVDQGAHKDNTMHGVRTYYDNVLPKISPVAVEQKFIAKIDGIPVRGVIDLVDKVAINDVIPGEGIPTHQELVADLKVVGRMWDQKKVGVNTQFTFYTLVRKETDCRIDFIVAGKKGFKYNPVETTRSLREQEILREDLVTVIQGIKAGIFPRCDPTMWLCTPKFCSYWSMCRGS